MVKDRTILLTQTGLDALQSELDQLVKIDRPRIIRDIDEARQMGDLRENEAYHAARHRQALIQGRIEELQHILKNAAVVDESAAVDGIVSIGSVVKLEVNDGHKQFTIVGEEEIDIANNKISHQSPLGKSLIGKKVGDVIQLNAPAGAIEYRVVEVLRS